MIRSVQSPRSSRGRRLRAALATAVLSASFTAPLALATATTAAAQTCTTANVLSGSHFEIDVNANLIVNGNADCIDWLTGGTNTPFRDQQGVKNDRPSGSSDDAFGQGSKEDDPNPTIVFGSIPPNKSDLLNFGVFTETNTTPKFLELFWRRRNNPSGTTNMDFELNQKFCDVTAIPTNCANNGSNATETPVRTPGDKLITYDLSNGGTVPIISIRTWSGSVWGGPTIISGGVNAQALGSVNTSTIPANQAGSLGPLDPFTFGEAAVSFNAIFPPGSGCRTFGSAYVKSRSSDSFPAELKDFIAPERVQITNCSSLITTATDTVTIGSPIHDTATLGGATSNAGGTISFHLFSNATCTAEINTGLPPVAVNGNGTYTSGEYTPTTVGSYYWTAVYSGDANNQGSSTACGDANETSVVTLAGTTTTTAQKVRPQDSATVSAGDGGIPQGSVLFQLYGPGIGCPAGNLVYSETVQLVNGAAATNNTTFAVDKGTEGDYKWVATYTPGNGDTTHTGSASQCGAEHTNIDITE
ncbi:Ig-like domain-containing protein [Streptomyces sp. NRRL S-87]|uniref:Ig-like domain-containing protein n=1 Tax=Streptomyces sp. NRRL S-87 TaxID=1463920 RepID=UPI0004C24DEA|nr:Ig-like domain-containing protein [Streptomyces sp. NRRL S-87]